jgi:hypothetical protein
MKYLKYLLRHKWYVGKECFKRGLYWQGIIHDWSKFLPSEFIQYNKYLKRPKETNSFLKSVALHHKRNPHHWQYWVLHSDRGEMKCFEIPEKYMLEMICDWIGAGIAKGHPSPCFDPLHETRTWYAINRQNIRLHRSTRKKIEKLLK